MDPFSPQTRTPSPPKPPGSGRLRNIIMPKPKLPPIAVSLPVAAAPPVSSYPSRLPIRKRPSAELLDENEGKGPALQERPYVRPRLNSGASVASVETIRPDALGRAAHPARDAIHLTRPEVRPVSKLPRRAIPLRAVSPDTSLTLPPRTVDASERAFVAGPSSQSRAAAAAGPVAPTKTRLTGTVSIPSGERATIQSASRPAPRTPDSTSLRRTASHRSLSQQSGKSFGFPSDEPDFLSEKDEAIVRAVVASIVEADEGGDTEPEDPDNFPEIPDEDEAQAVPSPFSGAIFSQLSANQGDSRFQLAIQPADSKHGAVWDANDNDYYAWQGYLVVKDREPDECSFGARCPVQTWDIEFASLDAQRAVCANASNSRRPAPLRYTTKWQGAVLQAEHVKKSMRAKHGICTEHVWTRTLPDAQGAHGSLWMLRFWVPVPMALFQRCESKMFRLKARVGVSEWDVPYTVVRAESMDVSIEHLRKERVMKVRK